MFSTPESGVSPESVRHGVLQTLARRLVVAALTFGESHVNGPVVLQALQLLLHAPLAAAVVQRAEQQHLQGSLALPVVVQHGLLLLAHQALAHHPVTGAAARVLVAHVTCLDAVHPLWLSLWPGPAI